MNKNSKEVQNYHQGIFITETILGNPNGSFMNNEPRNIKGRVFTTDKCIKYNIRNFIKQSYETIKGREKIEGVEDFVFFYPRKIEEAEEHQEKYLKKDGVFEKFFKGPYNKEQFKEMLKRCPDVRMFGGVFSFEKSELKNFQGSMYGPIQLSYGLDLMGADIINPQLGTPFSSSKGKQTTKGEDYMVDHAVISYDIIINPHNQKGLLKKKDLKLFKEALIKGTEIRKSTSKKTNPKLLMLIEFSQGEYPNLGDLKTLVKVENDKVTEEERGKSDLILNFKKVKETLIDYKKEIKNIIIYKGKDVKIENLGLDSKKEVKGLHELPSYTK